MKCDIILSFSGISNLRYVLTSKPDSKKWKKGDIIIAIPEDKEVDTVSDVIELLEANLTSERQKDLFRLALANASSYKRTQGIPKNLKSTVNGKSLLSNCTFEKLMSLFPDEFKSFLEPREDYNISLIDKGLIDGRDASGRFYVNGVVNYIFRSKEEVRKFVVTEEKKKLVDKFVTEDNILDEDDRKSMLRDHHLEKLKAVLEEVKDNKALAERIKYEQGEDINLHSLIIDYLNYSSDYDSKRVKYNDRLMTAGPILYDFCKDLNHELLIYDDTESDLAQALRSIHYKREYLGKKSLYKVLSDLVPGFSEKYSEEDFVVLNKEELTELLNPIFGEDVMLKNFEIKHVDKTEKKQKTLTEKLVRALFKKRVKEYNKEESVSSKISKETTYEQLIKTVEDAKKFKMDKYTDPHGNVYDLTIKVNPNDASTLIYTYMKNGLSDDDKITIKYKGYSLSKRGDGTDFNEFGYNTWNVYEAVDEVGTDEKDPITNGFYHGYYIYHTNKYGKDEYIISKSVIYPDMYVRGLFTSLKSAKSAVIGHNHSSYIKTASMVDIKTLEDSPSTSVNLGFRTTTGQCISSIHMPLSKDVLKKLGSVENSVFFSGKIKDVVSLYSNPLFGLSLRQIEEMKKVLDDPEKAGLLMLKLVDSGIKFDDVTSERIIEETVIGEDGTETTLLKKVTGLNSDLKKIFDETLRALKDPIYDHYVVRRYYEQSGEHNSDFPHVTYIQDLGDLELASNGTLEGNPWIEGADENGNMLRRTPMLSITTQLYTLKNIFNNDLFKDTGISIEITDNDAIMNDEEFKVNGESIFKFNDEFTPNQVKGFVYNNKIYINKSNVSSGIDTMFHEMFHILFGIMRAKDPESYYKALDIFDETKDKYRSTVNLVKKYYPNMSYYDFKEEFVVRQLARMVENGTSMFLPNSSDSEEFDDYKKRIFKDLMRGINLVQEQVKEAFSISDISDLSLKTSIQSMFLKDESLPEKLTKQRLVTNLLEKSLENESIIEICE